MASGGGGLRAISKRSTGLALALAGVGALAYLGYRQLAKRNTATQSPAISQNDVLPTLQESERVEQICIEDGERRKIERTPSPVESRNQLASEQDMQPNELQDQKTPEPKQDIQRTPSPVESYNQLASEQDMQHNDLQDQKTPEQKQDISHFEEENLTQSTDAFVTKDENDIVVIAKKNESDEKPVLVERGDSHISFDGSFISQESIEEARKHTEPESSMSLQSLPDSILEGSTASEESVIHVDSPEPQHEGEDTEAVSDIHQDKGEEVEHSGPSPGAGYQAGTSGPDSVFDGSIITEQKIQEALPPSQPHIEAVEPTADTTSTDSGSESESNDEESSGDAVYITHPADDTDTLAFGMEIKSEVKDKRSCHEVTDVTDGSPASQSGIKEGDVILRLNGMAVCQWSHGVLQEQFRLIPVDEIQMTVKRDDSNTYKELKARLKATEEGVAVASEELDIQASQIPPSHDLIISPSTSAEYKRPCHIACSQNDGSFLAALGRRLMLVDKHDKTAELAINFRREMYSCVDESPDSLYYQQGVHVFVFRAGRKGHLQGYITALNRSQVGLQRKQHVRYRQHSLQRADPRFFFHHFSASGHDCFESTQLPGHYLCCDGQTVGLKFLSTEKERDTDNQVHFILMYQ